MVQLLASAKGEGKTKRLIDMANQAVKKTEGHIVFIDDDNRHIYDLHYDIRFIQTTDYRVRGKSEFYGFLCGVLSQDRDVQEVYIDGLTNIAGNMTREDLGSFIKKLNELAEENGFKIIISVNCNSSDLPEDVKCYLVA